MKNIILQHWTGGLGPTRIGFQRKYRKYALQCNAEYKLIEGTNLDHGYSCVKN